ncbi:ribonuclease J [Petrocella sp. FN5]|uniref:ribonuclease J n=1 Tax=Petrocella sp. FN5 TaxID=3032002 RepID=UPI0023DB5BAE|nr:ribonuclease J [Petrocella sp. FN5]MDF1617039.1 ribonuclease J [Petrocella sp. FN5]
MNKSKSKLKILPLGGLEQIGMNITIFEYEDDIIVVDCGIAFPEDEMLGIDLVIPDVEYLKTNIDKVRGIVLTHGHEDHIGALPYVLRDINVPIYGTKLTIGLVENKLREHKILNDVTRNVITPGQKISLGVFNIEFIRTTHSIPDPVALAITTPVGVVVHTGDFKIDFTPIYGKPIDLQKFAEIGKKGVLLLMADSTNAERPGYTMSETTVARAFDELFSDFKGKRIIVATFASNVDRVQQIIHAAGKYKRKVVVEGRSMINVVATAIELGYIKMPPKMMITHEEMDQYRDGQIVIITTGSQGEPMAALSRMASKTHRHISIQKGDKVILSSKPIPGNEKTVSKVINSLFSQGAEVIFEDTHVSGHAYQEELKLIHSLVMPKYFVPLHGEVRHMKKHAELAESLGMRPDRITILAPGDVYELDFHSAEKTGHVNSQPIFVDGLGVGDVGSVVLRDRQKLSQDGLLTVVITMSKQTREVLAGPDIVSRGFVYVRESSDMMVEAKAVVLKALDQCSRKNIRDWNKIKMSVRDALRDYLWVQTKRNPMILPVIMEVDA